MSRNWPAAVSTYLSCGDLAGVDINGASPFSIAAWIYPRAGDGRIVTKWNDTGGTNQYYFDIVGQKIRGGTNDGATSPFITGVTNTPLNAWSHAGFRRNGSTGHVFLNGVADASGTCVNPQNGTSPLYIGSGTTGPSALYNGLIAEVALWDINLTDAEYAALAKGVNPLSIRRSNVRGYWPLFGLAYPEPDLSGRGDHLAQTGTVAAGATHPPVQPLASVVA